MLRLFPDCLPAGKPLQIPGNLLGYRRGENSGIRSRIGCHLLLVELLGNPQGLVRADLEKPGAIVLKLCQIIQKRRVLRLFFLFHGFHNRILQGRLGQEINELLGAFLFLEAVFLVEQGRGSVSAPFYGLPLKIKASSSELLLEKDTIKGLLVDNGRAVYESRGRHGCGIGDPDMLLYLRKAVLGELLPQFKDKTADLGEQLPWILRPAHKLGRNGLIQVVKIADFKLFHILSPHFL